MVLSCRLHVNCFSLLKNEAAWGMGGFVGIASGICFQLGVLIKSVVLGLKNVPCGAVR